MKGFLHLSMLTTFSVFIYYLLVINIVAYSMMWYDKYQSKKKGQRISENTLFAIAFICGALGIFLGMQTPIYHKAAKAKFKYGIPLMIVLNGICFYFIHRYS